MSLKKEHIWLVRLSLKTKKHPWSLTDFWVSESSYLENSLYNESPYVYGGLIELSGFSQTMGEVLPKASSGSLVLDNARGTLKSDKRWSDLLHHYAFFWQEISVYLFTKNLDQIGDAENLLLQFKGRIDDAKVNNDSNTFDLGLISDELSNEKPHYVIESFKNPEAPDGNLGVSLPVVFGENVQVPAVRINQDTSAPTFAYATNLSNSFSNKELKKLYIKKARDGYQEFTPASTVSTALVDRGPIPANETSSPLVDLDFQEYAINKSNAIPLREGIETQAGQVLTEIHWYLDHAESSLYTPDTYGAINYFDCSVSIMGSKNNAPDREVASGFIYLPHEFLSRVEYRGQFGSFTFSYIFKFYLNNYVIIEPDSLLFITFNFNEMHIDDVFGNPIPRFVPRVNDPGGVAYDRYMKMTNENNSDFIRRGQTASDKIECFKIFGLSKTDNLTGLAIDNKGYSASTFTITNSDSSNLDLSELEFVAEVDGLKDDPSGTITGSANQLITKPKDALKLLYYRQNNNSLSGFSYLRDEAALDSSFFGSIIKGATDSETTYRELIKDILFAFSSKMFPSLNGGYNLWSYGVDIIEDWEISEGDCVLNNYATLGKGSIINSVTINYDRRGIPLTLQNSQRSKDRKNYAKSQLFEVGTNSVGAIAYGSENLYEKEELSAVSESIDWFSSDFNADRFSRYMLSTKSDELLVINITVPLFKYDYKNIKLGDIVRLSHPDLPYEWGTASDGIEKLPSYQGIVDENFNFNQPWRRARHVLARVVTRSPVVRAKDEEPVINLVLIEISDREARRP